MAPLAALRKPNASLTTMLVCFGVAACSKPAPAPQENAGLAPATMANAEQPQIAAGDERECNQAKEAAVASRAVYDRDYERRNPGASSASLSVEELTSCRLSRSGAFVGKWGGQRWRYVPKVGGRYVRDPHQVWVGENEGLDDLSWFSEWRADGASVRKNEELNGLLKSARVIYG